MNWCTSGRVLSVIWLLFLYTQIWCSQTIKIPLNKKSKNDIKSIDKFDNVDLISEDEAVRRGLQSYNKTITNFQNLQYYATLYIGQNSKEMTFNYDTGSTTLWIPLDSCTDCPSTNKYTPTATYTNSGTPGSITYAKGFVSGNYATENIRLTTDLPAVNMSK